MLVTLPLHITTGKLVYECDRPDTQRSKHPVY